MSSSENPSNWPAEWASRQNTAQLLAWLDTQFNGLLLAFIRSEEQRELQIRVWGEALGGLTHGQIRAGKELALRLAGQAAPPPSPSRFRALCRVPPAQRSYTALPAPELSPEALADNRERMCKAIQRTATGRRCLYRPGYGPAEHAAVCAEVLAAGLPLYVADMRAMAANGWRESLEAAIRAEWMKLPGKRLVSAVHRGGKRMPDRNALYPPGHEPPDWVIRADESLHAAIDHWIATGQWELQAA